MTLTLSNNRILCIAALTLCAFLLRSAPAHAQSSLTLSVAPTLFEMAANPGQVWKSQVKVINSNSFDITVYPRVVNFAPQGESGEGKFMPVFEKVTDGATLAEWIDIKADPVVISSESSLQIPFTVSVPPDASPGGHFAAILVSTQPQDENEGLAVKTSQIVTSLFFVRVSGDVRENGQVRTFTVADAFVPKPKVTFELRFENKGNVHLQPQGDIRIFNMWGKERGRIPINERTHFGNVLPNSVRKFEFTWKGEQSIHDIGRYKAVASLAFGAESKQFVTSTTHFWVVPVKSLVITVGSFALFLLLVVWAIRMYVRKMLQLAGVPVDAPKRDRVVVIEEGDVAIGSYKNIAAPVRSGIDDLQNRLRGVEVLTEKLHVVGEFVVSYKKFFAGILAIMLAGILLYQYVTDVADEGKGYEVEIANPDITVNLTAAEVAYDEAAHERALPIFGDFPEVPYELDVINVSGETGLAGNFAAKLVAGKWYPTTMQAEGSRQDEKTKIVFDVALQNEAVELSRFLGGALLSARPDSASSSIPNMAVYVGKDQIPKK